MVLGGRCCDGNPEWESGRWAAVEKEDDVDDCQEGDHDVENENHRDPESWDHREDEGNDCQCVPRVSQ
eukprot:158981-Rhodomonas_salina.1